MRTNIHIKTRLSPTSTTEDRLNVAYLIIRRLKYENDMLMAKCEKQGKIITSLEDVSFFGTSPCNICGLYTFCERMERCLKCTKYYCESCNGEQLIVTRSSETCIGSQLCQDCSKYDQSSECSVCLYNSYQSQ